MNRDRLTVDEVIGLKGKRKLTMLAAYDHPSSRLADRAGIDMILVGDSLAKYALGLESNDLVGMTEMIHHAKAVSRGAARAMVVGDMPLDSVHGPAEDVAVEARRFLDEGGSDAVKIEWFDRCLEATAKILENGIPVIGHIGPALEPGNGGADTPEQRDALSRSLAAEAASLERLGCFCILLDHVDPEAARRITKALKIPTIGVGSGVHCDGQAVVLNQLVGWVDPDVPPPFTRYLELWPMIEKALEEFKRDVLEDRFPDPGHK